MPHDRSEVHLSADLSADLAAQPGRARESTAFRIAIVGNFSGRVSTGTSRPVAGRRTWRIDRDEVDAVLSRIAPELHITLDPSEPPLAIAVSALGDFHPDRLLQRLPIFQRLLSLRREVMAAPASPAAPPRRAERADAVAVDLSAGSLLDRIVESAQPETASTRQAARPDELSDFVARAVRSHMVAESTPEQRGLVAKVDDVIVATMRVLLHHPQFQSLESLWRGVDFLVRRLETSESMQVYLADVTREELMADLSSADITRTATYQLLGDDAGRPGEQVWSLLVGAYTFEPGDGELLSALATVGRALGAPWLAAAHPTFLGVESFAGTDPDDWAPSRSAAFDELRTSAVAPFLSLSTPRFLVRVPYGRRGEECETLPFEELGDDPPDNESFCWANPAFVSALAIGGSVADDGVPATRATIDRLPLYVAPVNGEPTATPCAEVLLTQHAVEELLDAGLTALVSPRDADTIVIPRLQSVARPPRPLAIRTPTA